MQRKWETNQRCQRGTWAKTHRYRPDTQILSRAHGPGDGECVGWHSVTQTRVCVCVCAVTCLLQCIYLNAAGKQESLISDDFISQTKTGLSYTQKRIFKDILKQAVVVKLHLMTAKEDGDPQMRGWGGGRAGGGRARVLLTTADTLIRVHSRERRQKQLLCNVT